MKRINIRKTGRLLVLLALPALFAPLPLRTPVVAAATPAAAFPQPAGPPSPAGAEPDSACPQGDDGCQEKCICEGWTEAQLVGAKNNATGVWSEQEPGCLRDCWVWGIYNGPRTTTEAWASACLSMMESQCSTCRQPARPEPEATITDTPPAEEPTSEPTPELMQGDATAVPEEATPTASPTPQYQVECSLTVNGGIRPEIPLNIEMRINPKPEETVSVVLSGDFTDYMDLFTPDGSASLPPQSSSLMTLKNRLLRIQWSDARLARFPMLLRYTESPQKPTRAKPWVENLRFFFEKQDGSVDPARRLGECSLSVDFIAYTWASSGPVSLRSRHTPAFAPVQTGSPIYSGDVMALGPIFQQGGDTVQADAETRRRLSRSLVGFSYINGVSTALRRNEQFNKTMPDGTLIVGFVPHPPTIFYIFDPPADFFGTESQGGLVKPIADIPFSDDVIELLVEKAAGKAVSVPVGAYADLLLDAYPIGEDDTKTLDERYAEKLPDLNKAEIEDIYAELKRTSPSQNKKINPVAIVLRSAVAARIDTGGIQIYSIEGAPLVDSGVGKPVELPSGSRMRVDTAGGASPPETASLPAAEQWWLTAFEPGAAPAEQPVVPGYILPAVLAGGACLGLLVIAGLVALGLRQRRR